MTSAKDPNSVAKEEADALNKIYANSTASTVKKGHYNPIGTTGTTGAASANTQKMEADIWNNLYKNTPSSGTPTRKTHAILRSAQSFFSGKKLKVALLSLGILIISGSSYFFIWGGGASYIHFIQLGGVAYTKNPTARDLPTQSVVKIFVNDEQSGSGIIFTKEGHILTNAHVLLSALGRNAKSIKVCYSDDNIQEVHCNYEATIVDINRDLDLAVIKTTKPITEVKPYLFVVDEQDELSASNLVPLGTQISVAGFPGVGGGSITLTKGIVSGYQNGETVNDDGSMQKIPYFLKTDTEINHGNSGGAAFDAGNRYIGIPSSYIQDEGGKIGYIIYWNRINTFLNHLVYAGKLSLPPEQYAKRITLPNEDALWSGIRAYYADDYKLALERLQKYTANHPSDSRAINYLCYSYIGLEDWSSLLSCSAQLRESNPNAEPLSWFFASVSDYSGKDVEKSYEDINKALLAKPDFVNLLGLKARIEIDLKRYADAKKTAEDILAIYDMNPTAYEVLGRVALEEDDYDNTRLYFEKSFSLEPNSDIADILAGYYMIQYKSDKKPEDLASSLAYRVGSVVLDQKNIDHLISLADDIVYLFGEAPGTWGQSLNSTQKLLVGFEVDRDLIEPILGISDDEIRTYLKTKHADVSQKDIDATRYYIKVSVAWLYTLIGEKNSCKTSFNDVMGSNMQNIFGALGKTQDEVIAIATKSVVLNCLCEDSDYSSDVLKACAVKKIKALK